MAWLSGWTYRKQITIDNTKVDADLTDFPVLVKLTSSNFDFSKALSNGDDIRFTSSDGTTLLSYERERHDSTNSKAEYWVKIPSVSSSADTTFYIYYGKSDASDGADPTNVWDSNFKGVWHLSADPSGTAPQELDSTSNNNNGTSGGSMTSDDLVDGEIGKALDFDGDDDYINCGEGNGTLDLTTDFTYSMWVSRQEFDVTDDLIEKNSASSNLDGAPTWFFNTENKHTFVVQNVKNVGGSTHPITDNDWHYIVVVRDSEDNWAFYVDDYGVDTVSDSTKVTANDEDFRLATSQSGSRYTKIIMDEVRVSSVARSAAYIKASYNSENDTLNTFGSEEVGTSIKDLIGGGIIAFPR